MSLFRFSTSFSFSSIFFIGWFVFLFPFFWNSNLVVFTGPVNQANSILMILSKQQDSNDFSIMSEQLQKRGYKLTWEKAEDQPELFQYGQVRFNHVIHLAPWVALQRGSSPVKYIQFLREGGNVLFLVNPNVTSTHEQLFWELGVTMDSKSELTMFSSLKDSSHTDSNQSMVQSKEYTFREPFLPPIPSTTTASKKGMEVDPESFFMAPEAIGHQLHTQSSSTSFHLLHTWLHAPADCVQKKKVNGGLVQPRLISSIQTLKQTRFSMVGSVKAFTNEYMQPSTSNKSTSSNLALFHKLTQWTFQETGVVRIAQVQHRHLDPIKALKKEPYRVKDKMIYEAKLETWNGDHWIPLKPSNTPHLSSNSKLTFEFTLTMLDPYLRRHLSLLTSSSSSSSSTTNSSSSSSLVNAFNLQTEVQWPTKYGVYTVDLILNSNPGYTFLHHSLDVPLLPLKHNQYPRYLVVAYPYYIAMFSQVIGMVVFVFLWIHTKDSNESKFKWKKASSTGVAEGNKKKTQ